MKATAFIAAVGVLAVAGSAFANDTRIYTGQGGPIPDGNPDGIRFEIFIPPDPIGNQEIKSIKEVILHDFQHTFAGDLIIILTHKDTGTSVTLLDRPGVPPGTFGNGDNFAGDYSFQDGFAPVSETAEGAGGDGIIDPGIYGPVGPGSLSAFIGESKAGIWSLFISDNAGADVGSLGAWSLVINNVPAPGALALLGLAGLAARRRRRSA